MQSRYQPSAPLREEIVDLRDYLLVLRRRIRLIVGVTVLGLVLALAYSFFQTRIYTAKVEVLVQPATTASSGLRPDQLISLETEGRLVVSAPIASLANDSLESGLTVTELLDHVAVQTTPETLVLDILYWDPIPEQAARGANAFADAYLEFKRQRALDAVVNARGFIGQQISDLETQVREQTQIINSTNTGSSAYRDAQALRDTLTGQIAFLQAQLANVPVIVDPGQVILPATPPASPSSPKHPLNGILGLFLGGFLGVVAAFVRDRTDDRLRGRSDLEAHLGVPVLSIVPHVKGWGRRDPARLVMRDQPRSAAAEAYRTLQNGVLFTARQKGLKSLAVVSPMVGEGKTATAANLAVALAQADNRVLVISADLRKPRLHQFFGLPNEWGLADILLQEATVPDAMFDPWITNLRVITSGRIPDNPAELLQSHRLQELLAEQRDSYDFVVIDCPPVLGLADSLTVASLVDGVILVAQSDSSKRGAILEAREHLEHVGAVLVGGVLNDVSLSRLGSYQYGYGVESVPASRQRTAPAPNGQRGLRRSLEGMEESRAGTPPEP